MPHLVVLPLTNAKDLMVESWSFPDRTWKEPSLPENMECCCKSRQNTELGGLMAWLGLFSFTPATSLPLLPASAWTILSQVPHFQPPRTTFLYRWLEQHIFRLLSFNPPDWVFSASRARDANSTAIKPLYCCQAPLPHCRNLVSVNSKSKHKQLICQICIQISCLFMSPSPVATGIQLCKRVENSQKKKTNNAKPSIIRFLIISKISC